MPISSKEAVSVASVLTESLPYIQKFHGSTIVVKYGGNAMITDELTQTFARDIVLMKLVGMNPIVVHGGGPQIGDLLEKLKIPTRFVDGMRVTDAATMDVVEMVLGGLVNQDIVSLINAVGGRAVGITGKDGQLIQAHKLQLRRDSHELNVARDHRHRRRWRNRHDQSRCGRYADRSGFHSGHRADRRRLHGRVVQHQCRYGGGQTRVALGRGETDAVDQHGGHPRQSGQYLDGPSIADVDALIADGTIHGGMLPKVRCALDAVAEGVRSAHIIDGRIRHAVLLEVFTDTGVGTLIRRSN